MDLVSSNNIPRLSTLLKVCLNSGMGVQSIIGRIGDAIQGKYSAKSYTDHDNDVALLVYRIGGPRLLHIVHTTHGLPSISTTLRCNKRIIPFFSAAVDKTWEDRINHNFQKMDQLPSKIHTIKMDEIATENRLCWNNADNKLYGVCYQHSHSHSMDINTVDDIAYHKELLNAGVIHKTKENLVVAVSEVGDGGNVTPILSLPLCCKTDNEQFTKMIEAVSQNLQVDVFATDGDAMRRRVFNSMMKPINNSGVKKILEKLPLFDLNFIDGNKALFFDDKHCAF